MNTQLSRIHDLNYATISAADKNKNGLLKDVVATVVINPNKPVLSINVFRPQRTGADMLNQYLALGSIELTQDPPGKGNYVLAGHRYQQDGRSFLFGNLEKVKVGMVVCVKTANISYYYKVSSKRIVSEADTSILDHTSTPSLTMITCDSANPHTTKRLVVTGEFLKSTWLIIGHQVNA